MECRGVIGTEDPISRQLVVWSSTQAPYMVRRALAQFMGVDEGRIRVIAPQVGGGFGPKAGVYPEEFAIALAAMKLAPPGQMGRGPARAFPVHHPAARPDLGSRGRGRRERPHARRARPLPARQRRLSALWADPALHQRRPVARALRARGARRHARRRLHQQGADHADPRRRPSQRGLRARAPRRPRGARTEARPRRGAPRAASCRKDAVPLRDRREGARRLARDLRQRRLSRLPRHGGRARRAISPPARRPRAPPANISASASRAMSRTPASAPTRARRSRSSPAARW